MGVPLTGRQHLSDDPLFEVQVLRALAFDIGNEADRNTRRVVAGTGVGRNLNVERQGQHSNVP